MNAVLVPCFSCRRHVRASESSCPFCAAALTLEVRAESVPPDVRRRLGSLAVMAFRATALSAAIATCGGKVEEPAEAADASSDAQDDATGAGRSSGGGAGSGGSGGIGGSSATGGSGGVGGGIGGSSGTGGTGGNPPYDGGPVPIYRATPPG